jgi:hypothetical protein
MKRCFQIFTEELKSFSKLKITLIVENVKTSGPVGLAKEKRRIKNLKDLTNCL